MKVLIADSFESSGVAGLQRICDDVKCEPGVKGDALVARIAEYDPDVLIVRSTKVPAAALQAGKRLKLVVRAGSGVDNIDVPAASERGINVANCPGMNAVAVAELVMGLIIALDRHIPDNVADLRAHKWNKKLYSRNALGLKGQTIGVIGAGRIGTEVARRALAFEMNVLYYHLGRNVRLAEFPTAKRVELDDLLRQSDVVTIHVPGGESTTRLLDESRLNLMKPHALLINTSRSNCVDEAALVQALKAGRIRGAAVDVYDNEPPADAVECNSPLCDVPNLYGTHHIGASTDQAQRAVADETVRIVEHYRSTGKVLNCVNLNLAPAASLLIARMHNRPGGLAHIFSNLAEAGINVEEMDHVIYDGGKAAAAHIRLNKLPSEGVLQRLRAGATILGIEVSAID